MTTTVQVVESMRPSRALGGQLLPVVFPLVPFLSRRTPPNSGPRHVAVHQSLGDGADAAGDVLKLQHFRRVQLDRVLDDRLVQAEGGQFGPGGLQGGAGDPYLVLHLDLRVAGRAERDA